VDLRRLIVLARAWLPLAVLCAVLAGVAGFVVSSFEQPVYEARTRLIVGQALSAANPDYSQLLVAQNLSATYAVVAETSSILEAAGSSLSPPLSPGAVASRVRVDAPRDSTFLYISAQDTDPARAAAIANAVAAQLIAASPSIQGREAAFQGSIDEDLVATQALIERTQARADALIAVTNPTAEQEADLQALEDRLASLRSTYTTLLSFSSGSATNLLTVLDPAVPPTTPVSPRVLFNTLLAAALGLLVIVGVAFVAEQLDDRIRDPDAVQDVAGVSTLGTIARMTSGRGRKEFYQLAGLLFPRSSFAEAYRTLRTNIEFASLDTPVRTLLVTSSTPGEGKTVTAANLAIVFAQSGRTVILVDADLRKPGIDSIFDVPNTRGLTDLLRHQSISVEAVAIATEQDNLRVVTTGPLPPNPAELLGSKRMRTVVQRLEQAADLVIFDSPPLLAVTDAAVMGSYLDGTLFVIDAAKGRRRLVRMGREALARSGAKTLGAVLNRVPAVTRFGYGGYYGHVGETPAATVVDLVADRGAASVDPPAPVADVQVPRAARARTSASRSRSTPRS
jgi:non-specific protein-tyrosine kinase